MLAFAERLPLCDGKLPYISRDEPSRPPGRTLPSSGLLKARGLCAIIDATQGQIVSDFFQFTVRFAGIHIATGISGRAGGRALGGACGAGIFMRQWTNAQANRRGG